VARLGTPRARQRASAVMLHGGARPDATEGGSGSTPFDRAPGNGDLARRRGRGPCQPAEERRPDLAGPASPPSPRIRGSRGDGLLRTGGCSAMEKRGGARSGPVAALPWATPSPPRSLGLELGAAATVATDPRKEDAERLLLPASCSRSPLSGEAGDGAAELPRGLELDAPPSLSSPCFAPPRAPPCREGGSARRSGRRCELDIQL
jgi:hypothetical protein